MRILLIEDDVKVANFIVQGLTKKSYTVDHCSDGQEGLDLCLNHFFNLIIVDRMLPSLSGVDIIKAIRKEENKTPVLILSAMGEVSDRVEGLNIGADDYLIKPFAMEELLARIDALLRREINQVFLQVADLEMDLLKHKVKRNGKRILLQPREYRLLEFLMKNAGRVVTRTMLLENVWEYHFDPQTNVIDVHISRLRQKIDKDFDNKLLGTVRGSGYKLKDG
ncbi:MAG: response regulator transcription factor [Pseudomonadota bacterium]